jgi:hypothetical protein
MEGLGQQGQAMKRTVQYGKDGRVRTGGSGQKGWTEGLGQQGQR